MGTKKQTSSFERCLDSANRRIGKVWAGLEETQSHLQRNDMTGANAAAFDTARHAEALALLCREMPAYSGHPKARAMINDAILESVPVEIGFTHKGWFCLKIPALMPKKNNNSPAYISEPVFSAMKNFWTGKPPVRYPDNVVIFRHVYNRERPEREYRDHDNTELNRILDIIALYVMIDDSAMRCRHYYCSAAGSADRTEVYVVPRDDFILWLAQEDTIPDRGAELYENMP